MRYLLDTCAIVFITKDSGDISAATQTLLEAEDAEVFVSAISVGELACAQERGKIKFRQHWRLWWNDLLQRSGWTCLPITGEIVAEAYSLSEPIHKDPADRILIATARVEKLTLVTTDGKILNYPHVQTLR